jgi:hypothetical protein
MAQDCQWVKSGDIWHINKDGIAGRSFEQNDGL